MLPYHSTSVFVGCNIGAILHTKDGYAVFSVFEYCIGNSLSHGAKRSIDGNLMAEHQDCNLSSYLFVLGPCMPYCNEGKPSLFLEEDSRWQGNNPGSQGLGQVTAVDTDSQGNVLIFHRASRIWQAE